MLLDMVLALTIVLLLAAIIWPSFGSGTTSLSESATALDIASLLRRDRTLATINGTPTETRIDLDQRILISASGRSVRVPADVTLEVATGRSCLTSQHRFAIVFSPDGTSCGGTITLRKGRASYVVRINWLSGMIDVVYVPRS